MVSTNNLVILGIAIAYLLIVIGIGQAAARITGKSREDFLMANRSFGTIVLFFALFATNMTAVVMIGGPGLAYQTGAGAMGFFVGLFAFLFPVFLMTIGYRIWLVGKEFGHITPAQIVNHRWNADYLGLIVMLMLSIWTIPYILVGVQGGGIVFESLTNGLVPYWAGALIILVVVSIYVYQGGMRATGWTNTFQGAIAIAFVFLLLLWLGYRLGGFANATATIAEINDGILLNRQGIPPFQPKTWFAQGAIVAFGAFMFPHLFLRYMTAKSVKNLQQTGYLYPIAVILVWVPAVMIGLWGVAQIPNLDNPDFILPAMIGEFLPFWVIGFALAGILAALMSSFDAQVLTLSTFFSEDIMREFTDTTEEREVWITRVFLFVVLGAAYVGALLTQESIVDTATFAFSGYGLMFFPIVSGFYWSRSNKEGALVGLVWGFVGLWLFEIGVLPMSLTFGFLPFIPLVVSQLIVMVVVTYLTAEPPAERAEEYEELFEGVW